MMCTGRRMVYRTGERGVSETEARTAECPDCGVKPGHPCVYFGPKSKKVGEPAQRSHNGRRHAAYRLRPPREVQRSTTHIVFTETEIRSLLKRAGDCDIETVGKLEDALWRLTGNWE